MIDLRFILTVVFSAAGAAVGSVVAVGPAGPVAGVLAGVMLARMISAEREKAEVAKPSAAPPRQLSAMALLDQMPAPVLLIDNRARLVRINSAAEALFGRFSVGEPLAATIRAPDLIDAAEETIIDRQSREAVFEITVSKTNRTLLAQIRALEPTFAPGDTTASPDTLVMIEDRTQETRVENMRQNFVANASHELKTPLASIIGFIETLQGPAKEDEEARERFLGIMASQAERMKRLVEDLLSLNRIELNTHVRPSDKIDLGALVHEVAAALDPVAEEHEASIAVACPREGPIVVGDRDQLAQLLTNFIDNALKYGGKGVAVTAETAAPDPKWPGMVGVAITDTGPGIAREHLPRLTERFYRVSATQSRTVGGTGLGLAIAKHIAQRHRGDIAISSEIGVGSQFILWLPGPAKPDS
ncbi:MAG: ATP-binding protein [Pseudomonadota bacterium]